MAKKPLLEENRLMGHAWPDGVPTEERALLFSLSEDRAKDLLRRLAAVLVAERPDQTSMNELAQSAGVSRTLFFEMRRRWAQRRSLSSLTSFKRVAARDVVHRGQGPEIAQLAADLVRTTPDYVAAGVVAREVAREVRNPNAYRAALRHVRRLRQQAGTDPQYLSMNYGQVIIIDMTAVCVRRGPGPKLALGDAVFVLERASGLVLAATLISNDDPIATQRSAAKQAIVFLADQIIDRSGTDLHCAETELVVADAPSAVTERLNEELESDPNVRVVDQGARRFGERIVSRFGSRFGRLEFTPRSTGKNRQTGLSEQVPLMPVPYAEAILASEVAHHNEPLLSALQETASTGGLELLPSGSLGIRLQLVASALGASFVT
ncbi:MAG: hypothetical protein WKF52_06520 [Sphingomicrobium sp.]